MGHGCSSDILLKQADLVRRVGRMLFADGFVGVSGLMESLQKL